MDRSLLAACQCPMTWPSVSCRCRRGQNKELVIFGILHLHVNKDAIGEICSTVYFKKNNKSQQEFLKHIHSLAHKVPPTDLQCELWSLTSLSETAPLAVFGGLWSPMQSCYRKQGTDNKMILRTIGIFILAN